METLAPENLDEKTINKIQSLMNLTNTKGATENEAANATAHVMRLLAKYNLDVAEFDKILNKPESIDRERLQEEGRSMPTWKTNLLGAIARAHFCAIYLTTGYRKTSHVVVGKPTNVQAVKIVYAFLCSVVDSESKEAIKAYTGWEHGKTYGNSFRLGMVARIAERLRGEMKLIQEEHVLALNGKQSEDVIPGVTTSIVVKNMFDEAQKEIQEYYKSIGLKLGHSHYSASSKSSTGYSTGYKAGANVPLTASPSLNRRNK